MIQTEDFKKEVFEWSNELGIIPQQVQVRMMKRKWASCSSKKRLTFSYEVLNKTYSERSHIIVHELLHLKYETHNKMFKLLLKTILLKKGISFAEQI
jgi:predicted metal-dependent hydrolase